MTKITVLAKTPAIPIDQPVEVALFDPFGNVCSQYHGFKNMLEIHKALRINGELGQAAKYKEVVRGLSSYQIEALEGGIKDTNLCDSIFTLYKNSFLKLTKRSQLNNMRSIGGVELRLKSDPTQTSRWYFVGSFTKDKGFIYTTYDSASRELTLHVMLIDLVLYFTKEIGVLLPNLIKDESVFDSSFNLGQCDDKEGLIEIPHSCSSSMDIIENKETNSTVSGSSNDVWKLPEIFHLEIGNKKFDVPSILFDTVIVNNAFDVRFIKTV